MSGEVTKCINELLDAKLSDLAKDHEIVGTMYKMAFQKISKAKVVDERAWLLVWIDLAYSAPTAARDFGVPEGETFRSLLDRFREDGVFMAVSELTANLLLEVLDRAPPGLRSELQWVLADRARLARDPSVVVKDLKTIHGG